MDGLCVAGVILAAGAIYATAVGEGNPLDGLEKMGRGNDPLSQAMAATVAAGVELSMENFPEQTLATLGVLEAIGEASDIAVKYVDEKTGKVVSTNWNKIPEETRNQIKGGITVASFAIPAGAVTKLSKLIKARRTGGGGLRVHKNAGGHLIDRHVGKADADLIARLNAQPNITAASTFPNRATAERAVSSAIDANGTRIGDFLSGATNRLVIDHNVGSTVGTVVTRGSTSSVSASSVRIVLQRDASMPTGYRIVTGYPAP